ncbi:MAG: hypothetical protein OIF36_03870 [Alphaproteobacteria bacterium]|nr:hypothetical protein [Alphaproteobacteria bacterium]
MVNTEKSHLLRISPEFKALDRKLSAFKTTSIFPKYIKEYVVSEVKRQIKASYNFIDHKEFKKGALENLKHLYFVLQVFNKNEELYNSIFKNQDIDQIKKEVLIKKLLSAYESIGSSYYNSQSKLEYKEGYKKLKKMAVNFKTKFRDISKRTISLTQSRDIDREVFNLQNSSLEKINDGISDLEEVLSYIEQVANEKAFVDSKYSQKISSDNAIPLFISKIMYDFFIDSLNKPHYKDIAEITNSFLSLYFPEDEDVAIYSDGTIKSALQDYIKNKV